MEIYKQDAACVKCGHMIIRDIYCGGKRRRIVCRVYGAGHIHRICENCGYEWLEAPLDCERTVERELL